MTRAIARSPRGVPTGGQFVQARREEPEVELEPVDSGGAESDRLVTKQEAFAHAAVLRSQGLDVRTFDGRPGMECTIDIWIDGRQSDAPDGTPASQSFHRNDALKFELHMRDGVVHNPAPDVAAERTWYEDGTPHQINFVDNGKSQDPDDATPACRYFHANGQVASASFSTADALHDPPSGEPASQEFDDRGNLTLSQHYRRGVPCDPEDGSPGRVSFDRFGRRSERFVSPGGGR